VDDHQAPLAAPAERHRWRQLHLGAWVEAIDIEQLLVFESRLPAEAFDQRLLIDGRVGLEHEVRDDAVELERHLEVSFLQIAAALAQEPLEPQQTDEQQQQSGFAPQLDIRPAVDPDDARLVECEVARELVDWPEGP